MRRAVFLLLPLLAVLASCGDGAATDGRLVVAVSVEPHAFVAERIGGERVTVQVLVGPGESPASYQPSDLQVTEVLRAAVYFRTGVPFERGKWLPAIRGMADGPRVVDLREAVELRAMESGHEHGEHGEQAALDDRDPHIWLSPTGLISQAELVCAALAEADPEGREEFEANLRLLVSDLAEARMEAKEILAPVRGRRVLVFHPAYGYFCDEFGLRQVAIEAEGKEPSDREMTALLHQARASGARAVFVQEQIHGRAAQAVADSLGVGLIRLDPLARDVPENYVRMARKIRRSFP